MQEVRNGEREENREKSKIVNELLIRSRRSRKKVDGRK